MRRRWRFLEPRLAGPLIGAAVVLVSAFFIYRFSGQVHLRDIRAALAATPWSTVALSAGFTGVSFLALSLYDVLAVRRVVPGRVSDRFAAFAGATGFAIANAVGFHVLVGGPIRYRIYAAAGLDVADVGRIVGLSVLTFWLGMAAVVGAVLLFDPAGIPLLQFVAPRIDRLAGGAILGALALFVLWLSTGAREITLFGWRLMLPRGGSAILQIAIGAIDIAAAAGALYVLLPADVAPGLAVFTILFITAVVAGSASHAPGGLGVLEATILLGLGAGDRPDVIAALLAFRIIYYVLPMAIAGLALTAMEAYQLRASVLSISRRTFLAARPAVAPTIAALVFFGGVVLVLSSDLPAEGGRIGVLRDVLPLPFAEASHMAASLVGLLLIVLARGILQRIALARNAAIALLLAGAMFSLAKGLDWEEAGILLAIAAVLVFYRDVFYRSGDRGAFRPSTIWLATVAITMIALTLVGLLAFRHVEYRPELWWEFAWRGDAPRFLRATLVLAIATGAIGLDALINRPAQSRPGPVPIPDAVRAILARCPTTQPQIALLGDKRFLLAADDSAFLMYGVTGRSWITMGDPVGDPAAGRDLVWRFAEDADRAGARAVFYAVEPDMLPVYVEFGLSILKIGEVARVDLDAFSLDASESRDFRYAARRAVREGLAFAVIPKADVPALMPELKIVSDAWLTLKVGHEKGFSLGRFDARYLAEFDCAVMRRDGAVVAFANIWRGAERHELSVDLMRYLPGVSKVMMDALFAELMLYGKAERYRWFNLGAAPLAGLADHPLASTWNRIGTFIYRRGDEIYNFEGLRAFKQKFSPVWTPQYIACPGGLAIPQVLFDVTRLMAGGPVAILRR